MRIYSTHKVRPLIVIARHALHCTTQGDNDAMDLHVICPVEEFNVSTVIVNPPYRCRRPLCRKQGSELEPIAWRFALIKSRVVSNAFTFRMMFSIVAISSTIR